MTDRLRPLSRALILTVILAMLLQPMAGIDLHPPTLDVAAETAETGARQAQTEWVGEIEMGNGGQAAVMWPNKVAVDGQGDLITTGMLLGDVTFGTHGSASSGVYDQLGYIAKADGQTGNWNWLTETGSYDGGGNAAFTGVATHMNDIYTCGWFVGNVSFGSQQFRSTQDSQDLFVSKLDASGAWLWTAVAGGSTSDDTCEDVATDSAGNVYVAGTFNGSASFHSTGVTTQGETDAWFAEMDTSANPSGGNRWAWVTTAGGTTSDYGACIASDGTNVFGCGWFSGTADFGSQQQQAIGQFDSFVMKMNGNGGVVDSNQAGATGGIVQIFDMIADSGTTYVTGHVVGSANFGQHQVSSGSGGANDRFITVAALGPNNLWSWATASTAGSYQTARGMDMTGTGDLVITGTFGSINSAGTGLDAAGSATFGSDTLSSSYLGIVVAGISTSGAWTWAEAGDGNLNDEGYDVAVTPTGTIVAMGNHCAGGVTSGNACSITLGTSTASSTGNFFSDGSQNGNRYFFATGVHLWAIMGDADGDGVGDADDNCLSTPNTDQSDIDGDLMGDVCDDDIDGDGKLNPADNCDGPEVNWNNTDVGLDMDQDGCLDSTEDTDDDADGISDVADKCSGPAFKQQWSSTAANDHDSDGCHDQEEDADDDDDGVEDLAGDDCPRGWHNWTSDASTDHDSDGCADAGEDADDDNDGVDDLDGDANTLDLCRLGELGWVSDPTNDRDADGCRDATEDQDDDADGVSDASDSCPAGAMEWYSVPSTDHDGDGCRDLDEDDDDDGDTIEDANDACPMGMTGWISDPLTDLDGDGCRDSDEDTDDDADGFEDGADGCPRGETGWFSTTENDFDRDGCHDDLEDDDDDGDTVSDEVDECPFTPAGEDIDVVGCGWMTQQDRDLDGVWDHLDNCQNTPSPLIRDTFAVAHGHSVDEIGCWPGESDDDDDGKLLYIDDCPNTPPAYKSQTEVDGCHVSEYDLDGDGVTGDFVHPHGDDQCTGTSNETVRANNPAFGSLDFGCWYGDDDSDADAILLHLDQCPETPAGEDVLTEGELIGCAASERDEDGDGVSTDVDVCPETPEGVDVVAEGQYAGCSLEERVELGDTSAVIEQNILFIVGGAVLLFVVVAALATMVLRRGGGASDGAVDWDAVPAVPPGFDMAAASGQPQVAKDYTALPGGGSYSTGAMGETIYNAPDGSDWQMQTDGSFIRI